MPSPFPGMDPYLESAHLWEDFHARLATEIADQLTPRLRPRYVAALTPRIVYDEVVIQQPRVAKPDVGVHRTSDKSSAPAAALISPPVLVGLAAIEEPMREQSIEIRAVPAGELVAAIEILSPVNKRAGHEAHIAYHRKRRSLIRADVHLLEIDLLRAGRRPPRLVTPLPDAPYFVFLSRAGRGASVEIWPMSFREQLPVVPVPLLEPDPDAPLHLGQATRAIYDRAAYDLRINYRELPPEPKFSDTDLAWISQQLGQQLG